MPLDRPIIVGIRGPDDHNAAGIFVPGPVTDYPVFATVIDLTQTRDIMAGGARLRVDRIYRVRWFEELALAPVTSVEVTSELGFHFGPTAVGNISEFVGRFQDLRRRWLDIEIVRAQEARL